MKSVKNTVFFLSSIFVCFFLSVPIVNLMFISKNAEKIEKNEIKLNNIEDKIDIVLKQIPTTQPLTSIKE